MEQLFSNYILICAVCAWMVCQVFKILLYGFRLHQWNIRYLWAAGGMPSSHSASAVALATAVGLHEGFSSGLFAACAVFAFVVMYDAAGVRRETGKQGQEGDEPYYPVNDVRNNELYLRYRALAEKEGNVLFGGRLGTYRYLDMDDTIRLALDAARKAFRNPEGRER